MAKSRVAILRTSPRTVLADHHRLMNLAGYQEVIDKSVDTALGHWHNLVDTVVRMVGALAGRG